MATPQFKYYDPYPLGEDKTNYYLFSNDFTSVDVFNGEEILIIKPEGLTRMARRAMRDVSFMLRTQHFKQLGAVLSDSQSSANDKYVALTMLKNAEIASKGVLPICQDTGTATVFAKKGQWVWTGANDAEALSLGVYKTFTEENLRYSQVVPLDMYTEKNSGSNLPIQVDINATCGKDYQFLFIAKGGGSANKTMLFQETKALLNPERLEEFIIEKMRALGTSGCPPYHIVFVIGGTSAEACLKYVKLGSAKYLDFLPTQGNIGGQAFRDVKLEERVLNAAYNLGIGAQFGGKYFALDIRIIRLPRHGASCPVGIGVSCAADRNIKAKINKEGIWIERLEENPGRFIPDTCREHGPEGAVSINLNRPMNEILASLSKHSVGTRLLLTGTIIVGRDIVHAKLKERLEKGESLPDYIKNHPIYYAGPAKTPAGLVSGSFGPTTANRMDPYVDLLQRNGGSLVMIAKGNRTKAVVDACKEYGGFYLGSIGGPAAILAQENIREVKLLEYPELGMEAVYKIEVENFPAFILIDDKGNDFYATL